MGSKCIDTIWGLQQHAGVGLTSDLVSNHGERVLETERVGLVREHMDRYRFARRHISQHGDVLDCACGSGYGATILSQYARSVTGIDVSEVALDFCRQTYRRENLKFLMGDALALKNSSNSIDSYISFETIEHVADPAALLKEARRVLKPGGLLLVSTPNRVFSGIGSGEKPTNPFHLREWSLAEFHAELQPYFSSIQYYCQRVKAQNKVHPRYLRSKIRRVLGIPDLCPFDYDDEIARDLQSPSSWMPMVYLAVCRK